MAVNSEANDLSKLENVNSFVQKLSNTTSVQGIDEFSMSISKREVDLMSMLNSLTEDIDKPILKSLANDMIGLFGSFYVDDDALCCLIKNLMIQLGLQSKLEKYNDFINDIAAQQLDGVFIDEDNFALVVAETDFGRAIDTTIAIVDIILTFATLDINDLIMPSLDLIRELTEAVTGFICIALQEIIFTIRDSAIDWILQQIDETTSTDSWAKCMPYMDFVAVLKKYIHDYGLTKKLMALMEGFIGNVHSKLSKALKADLAKNVKLIEFLNLVRSILVNIKEAVISWEFCVFLGKEQDFNGYNNGEGDSSNPYFNHLKDILNNVNTTSDYGRNDFVFGDDNTILNNKDGASTGTGDGDSNNTNAQNSQRIPPNDELSAFLQNYMNLSSDRTDQVLSDSGLNRGDGSSGTRNSCGNVINESDISNIIDNIINKSRVS